MTRRGICVYLCFILFYLDKEKVIRKLVGRSIYLWVFGKKSEGKGMEGIC